MSCVGIERSPVNRRRRAAPGQPGLLLPHFVGVRMVDERPGARRREPRLERIARRDRRRDAARMPGEAGDAVVVAIELDAVPVHRRRSVQLVHHGDAHRLAALEQDRRAGQQRRARRATSSTVVQHVAERRLAVVPPESARATSRSRRRAARLAAMPGRSVGSRTSMPITRPPIISSAWFSTCTSCSAGERRAVERRVAQHVEVVVAVEQPVAGALRHPRHRERAARRDALRHDAMRRRRRDRTCCRAFRRRGCRR